VTCSPGCRYCAGSGYRPGKRPPAVWSQSYNAIQARFWFKEMLRPTMRVKNGEAEAFLARARASSSRRSREWVAHEVAQGRGRVLLGFDAEGKSRWAPECGCEKVWLRQAPGCHECGERMRGSRGAWRCPDCGAATGVFGPCPVHGYAQEAA
jgi:hypothetical protein